MRCGSVVPGGRGSLHIEAQHLSRQGHPHTDKLSPPSGLCYCAGIIWFILVTPASHTELYTTVGAHLRFSEQMTE